MNPNYDSYLQTATQLQRWRDFQAHVVAYLVINIVFVAIWALTGQGFFWPVYPWVSTVERGFWAADGMMVQVGGLRLAANGETA